SILIPKTNLACPKISSMTMERTPCFGVCPYYKITLFEDGRIFYHGKKDTPRIGQFEGRISAVEAKRILNKFAKKKVDVAPDEYKFVSRDISLLNFNFIINKKNKTINKANFGPAYFEHLAKELDAIAEKVTWQKAIDNDLE
ncbi:MAG: hypothetical protein KA275_09630, partial [Chitinophagaceae bacterium]|nr:hypothetical protein [Chitinophagaceae bacterium]